MKRLLLFALGCALVPGVVPAATYQVPGDFATLLAAADAAAAGDSILLAPGTYSARETRSVGPEMIRASAFVPPGVTIVGTDGAEATLVVADAPEPGAVNAILVPSGSAPAFIDVQGVTLRGGDPGIVAIDTRPVEQVQIRLGGCILEECGSVAYHAATGDFELRDCTVRNNDATVAAYPAILQMESTDFLAEGCRFEDNRGRLIGALPPPADNTVAIDSCDFFRTEGGEVLWAGELPVSIEDSRFVDNVVTGALLSVIWVYNSVTVIRGNLFLRNSSESWNVIRARNGPHNVEHNTFYDNFAGEALIFIRNSFSVGENVFAETGGGPALIGYFEVSRGCNIFWNSTIPDSYRREQDLLLDPQFCDPAEEDFTVAQSSPCLAVNNYASCGDIGRYGAACPGNGIGYCAVDAELERPVTVDGVTYDPPRVFAWPQGSVHTIGVEEVHVTGDGRRVSFREWSDGGAATHDIVAPDNFAAYTAMFDVEYLLTMQADSGGTVQPETGWYPAGSIVQIEAFPDFGYLFTEWEGIGAWSYSGPTNPKNVSMNGPFTEIAHFGPGEFELATGTVGPGRVVPEDGIFEAFSDLLIRARPERGHHFVEWKGQGAGSYTGRANPVTVTFDEPLTQVAHFAPVRFDLRLSLSATNSNVQEGPPVGDVGEVHLWMVCAGGRRIQEVEIRVDGTMDVLTFVPAPGMVSKGTNPIIVNTAVCRWASVRLGHFLVSDQAGGDLCLDTASGGTPLVVTDCSDSEIPWPERVSFVGVNTTGGQACSTGTGCIRTIEQGAGRGDGTAVALTTPLRTGLHGVFPNPTGSTAAVRFSVARPQHVKITVYDVAGRRVRGLRDAPAEVGTSSVVWDGRDERGSAVAAGVYFVRMQGEDADETRKVVRVGSLR